MAVPRRYAFAGTADLRRRGTALRVRPPLGRRTVRGAREADPSLAGYG
jgi:hypothetical protein